MRHAFRNSLIPITTIVAADVGALIGGAIITERIFAFSGMGALFNSGLNNSDPNPVMAYFVVIADRRHHVQLPRRPRLFGARPESEGQVMTIPMGANFEAPAEPAAEPTKVVTADEKGLSQGRLIFRRFIQHKPALISIVLFVLIVGLRDLRDGDLRHPGLVAVELHLAAADPGQRRSPR